MHPLLAGSMLAWRERTRCPKDNDYVFRSVRLGGRKPLSASIMVQKYLRPAAVKAGVIATDWKGRFGLHNFRHSLATAMVKLRVDPKTVQGILRHEDFGTTMELYAQSDMESMRDDAREIPRTTDGRQNPPAHGASSVRIMGGIMGGRFRLCAAKFFRMMVARDGVEPPTPAFSGLASIAQTA
jgi:hypothetical protein